MSNSNIVLIGFMGTGKTTVGTLLAKRLGWKFKDTDQLIVENAGMMIPEIFERHGQAHFRDLEQEAIEVVMQGKEQVISTGGGSVLRESNREAMLRGGFVVALTASEQTIARRVSEDKNRPLLQGDALANIRRLLQERKDAYRFAHATIDTDELDAEEIVQHILSMYEES